MPRHFLTNITTRHRGRLPHWEQADATYFITYRLADSLPLHVVRRLKHERETLLRHAATSIDKVNIRRTFMDRIDEELDHGCGACHLRNPRIAQLVTENLRHFDGARYDLAAYCVMPNHVHVVMRVRGVQKLEKILHSWKSYTSKAANALLGRTGKFWEEEYFDHIVRNDEELVHTIAYIVANPVKAGLRDWPFVWEAGVPPA